MMLIRFIKICIYPFRFIFGSGIGNIRLLKWIFTKVVNIIPKKYFVLDVNGCKLGMTIGKGRGFDSMASGLIFGKGYEVGTTKLFKRLVKQGMNVVDIGAHIGYYTVLASKLVEEKGHVWAFEPEPKNYEELKGNIKLNELGNVFDMNLAIGDNHKSSELYYSKIWSGECSLVDIKQRPKDTIKIQVETLDSLLKGKRIDVIKMDVDGGEMMVLEGARGVIEQNAHLIMFAEFFKYGIEGAGYTIKEYWEKLNSQFPYVYCIEDRNGRIKLLTLDKITEILTKTDGVNILCSKKEI